MKEINCAGVAGRASRASWEATMFREHLPDFAPVNKLPLAGHLLSLRRLVKTPVLNVNANWKSPAPCNWITLGAAQSSNAEDAAQSKIVRDR